MGAFQRFGRGAVAGGSGATGGVLQALLMNRKEEQQGVENTRQAKVDDLRQRYMLAQIAGMGQPEPEKPDKPTETGILAQILQEDPEQYIDIKRRIGGVGEKSTSGEKTVAPKPKEHKPDITPLQVMDILTGLTENTLDPQGVFYGKSPDSLFSVLAGKAGVSLPKAQPQRSMPWDEPERVPLQAPGQAQQAGDPEIVKAQQKLASGEWDQATFDQFIEWYQSQ